MHLGKSAIISLTDLGKPDYSWESLVFNATSMGASGKPALVSKGPHKQ